jgi:hypothetical protein
VPHFRCSPCETGQIAGSSPPLAGRVSERWPCEHRLATPRRHYVDTAYHHDWLGPLWERAGADSAADCIAYGWQECFDALDRLDAALPAFDGTQDPCRYTGQGWIAEEALTTALLCALHNDSNPVDAPARAATASGDSDSIGCLTGAMLGAAHGMTAWPPPWADQIEYRDQLTELASIWDTH